MKIIFFSTKGQKSKFRKVHCLFTKNAEYYILSTIVGFRFYSGPT